MPLKTEIWVSQCIPPSLEGMKVLDVGAWDGYYSFLCEQRGAHVTAIDISHEHRRGFEVARSILNSRVQYETMSVYDIDQLPQNFDYVLCFGVLYHLENPILALRKIREKCTGMMLLETASILSPRSTVDFVWPKHPDQTTYWRFSNKALIRMCKLAGFRDVETKAFKWYVPLRRGRTLIEASC